MKATEFLEEWNRTHTSSPSFQDILDWVEQKHSEEMKELNNEWRATLTLQKQGVIYKAYRWLKARNVLVDDCLIGFMDAMEKEL